MSIFSRFRPRPEKANAEALLARITSQARAPRFFADLGVPDTVDGRFDMLVLVTFLVLRRLKEEGNRAERLSQALFDAMFSSMDDSLRHMGVGDLSVGKRIKKMSEAFYGRVNAYDKPLIEGNRKALAAALERNLYRSAEVDAAHPLAVADFMIETFTLLRAQPLERLQLGLVDFETRDVALEGSAS